MGIVVHENRLRLLNGLVYCALGTVTATVEDFDRLMAVNARSTFLCYKLAARQMIAQGRGGRIIGA